MSSGFLCINIDFLPQPEEIPSYLGEDVLRLALHTVVSAKRCTHLVLTPNK